MNTLEAITPVFAQEVSATLASADHDVLAQTIPCMRIRRCSHDVEANAGYIYLEVPPYPVPEVHKEAAAVAETVVFGEPHWFNVDVDHEGNALGIEILGREDVVSQLKRAGAL
ncbi:MAG: hypothetical protein ACRD22_07295 [Terriglobia bacterium]